MFKREVWTGDVHVKGIDSHEETSSVVALGASLSSQNIRSFLNCVQMILSMSKASHGVRQ